MGGRAHDTFWGDGDRSVMLRKPLYLALLYCCRKALSVTVTRMSNAVDVDAAFGARFKLKSIKSPASLAFDGSDAVRVASRTGLNVVMPTISVAWRGVS